MYVHLTFILKKSNASTNRTLLAHMYLILIILLYKGSLDVHFEEIEMLIQPHSARNLRGPLLGSFLLRSNSITLQNHTTTVTMLNQTQFVVPRGAVASLNPNTDRAELRLETDPIVMRSWMSICLAALSVLVVFFTRECVRFTPPPNSNASGSAGAAALMILDGELAGTL